MELYALIFLITSVFKTFVSIFVMNFQVARFSVFIATMRAEVWFFTCMCSDMYFQSRGCLEFLVTMGATMFSLRITFVVVSYMDF